MFLGIFRKRVKDLFKALERPSFNITSVTGHTLSCSAVLRQRMIGDLEDLQSCRSFSVKLLSTCPFHCFHEQFLFSSTQLLAMNHQIIRLGKALQDHLVQQSPYYQCHLINHVPKHHVRAFLKHPQGR